MEATLTFAFLVAVIPLCGALMAATPYLMPKRECFAATIPEHAQTDPTIMGFKKSFAIRCLILTAACTVFMAGMAFWVADNSFSSETSSTFCMALCAAAVVVTVVPFAFMLRFRKKVVALKRERGWNAPCRQAAAIVGEDDVPHAISLAWNLLYIPVLLVIAAVGIALYPSMPDAIPMHADFNGNITDTAPKSIGTVFGFPVLLTVFLAGCMFISHWGMVRSKKPTDPGAPATSALAYGMFARAQSILLLATGVTLSSVVGILFMLSSAGAVELVHAGAIVLLACVPVVGGSIALTFIYGQSGSRLFLRMESAQGAECDRMPADDDEHWKLGIFYYNPEDPSLWLPERFGIGWTVNLARPAAWVLIAGFTISTCVFIGLCAAIAG